MLDKEKIIKRLEEIPDYFFAIYQHLKDEEEIKEAEDICDTVEDALTLLKEQEAKTVIKIAKRFNDCDLTGYCPFCSRPLIKDWAENYCGYCGKPVLWEGR